MGQDCSGQRLYSGKFGRPSASFHETQFHFQKKKIFIFSPPRLTPDSLLLLSPQPTAAHPDGPPVANNMDAFFPP